MKLFFRISHVPSCNRDFHMLLSWVIYSSQDAYLAVRMDFMSKGLRATYLAMFRSVLSCLLVYEAVSCCRRMDSSQGKSS